MNYKIQSGDTLTKVAARFGTTVDALAKTNGIENVNQIQAGANLNVDAFEPAKNGSHTPTPQTTRLETDKPTQTQQPGRGSIPTTPKMQKLADAGRRAAMGMGGFHSQKLCATGVSRAIKSALGISVHGNGNQIDNNLPKNKFKQLNISLADALKIPGCVLTWEKTSTKAGQKYGHTAITTGDGHTSTSDFIEKDTLNGSRHRSGLKIFVPI